MKCKIILYFILSFANQQKNAILFIFSELFGSNACLENRKNDEL